MFVLTSKKNESFKNRVNFFNNFKCSLAVHIRRFCPRGSRVNICSSTFVFLGRIIFLFWRVEQFIFQFLLSEKSFAKLFQFCENWFPKVIEVLQLTKLFMFESIKLATQTVLTLFWWALASSQILLEFRWLRQSDVWSVWRNSIQLDWVSWFMKFLKVRAAFYQYVVCIPLSNRYFVLVEQTHSKLHKDVNLCFVMSLWGAMLELFCFKNSIVLRQDNLDFFFFVKVSLSAANTRAQTILFKLLVQVLPTCAT